MRAWSAVPRFGEATPDPRFGRPKGSVRGRIRAARLAALIGGVLLLAMGIATTAWALDIGQADSVEVSGRGFLILVTGPLLVATLATAAVRAIVPADMDLRFLPRGSLAVAAMAMATTGAAIVQILIVVPSWGASVGRWAPGAFIEPYAAAGPSLGISIAVVLAVAAMTGLYVHAVALAVDGAGLAPSRAPFVRALAAREAGGILTPPRPVEYVTGALHVTVLGFAVPALAIAGLAGTIIRNARARAVGDIRDELHCDVDLESLGEGLAEEQFGSRAWDRHLDVSVPVANPTDVKLDAADSRVRRFIADLARVGERARDDDEDGVDVVRVSQRHVTVPPLAHGNTLLLRGSPRAVRRLRRVIETRVLFRCVFAWSEEAVRYERRLNRLAREAITARTVEERALLLDEANRLEVILNGRAFLEEEWNVLAGWKTARVRAFVQDMMLTEPVGLKSPGRVLAAGPALPLHLGRLVESAGLANVVKIRYVPYWLIPVATGLGERDILVNALTRRVDLEESAELLDAVARDGTTYFVDGTRKSQFIPPIPPSGALFGEVRQSLRLGLGYRGPIHVEDELLDTIYVPFAEISTEGRVVNAVTGRDAPDVAQALPPEPDATKPIRTR